MGGGRGWERWFFLIMGGGGGTEAGREGGTELDFGDEVLF